MENANKRKAQKRISMAWLYEGKVKRYVEDYCILYQLARVQVDARIV